MKKLFILFSFIFCVGAFADSTWRESLRGFSPITNNNPNFNLTKEAVSEAIQYLKITSSQNNIALNQSGKLLARNVMLKLQNIILKYPVTYDSFQYCNQRMAFFNHDPEFINTIFICPFMYEMASQSFRIESEKRSAIAQLTIHEGVHATGNRDECVATELEIRIMNATVGVKSWGNVDKYKAKEGVPGCNFDWIK